ncbi:hypothetical protein CXZ10_06025 [Pleomorphomonas diazotrophica]|uniref:Uncharacterized protein n=1 Tax=Pleomorphomonas diazotrophica TaxID=1166257 RepID=A0A1I4Q6F1_9HYPH|nr:phage regulatory CII family protein [Pleomorphomonas diazotrophica]PKR90902.1 hypothetical protein CXZ10_06025 [Pleomorphomonas diazotrophica]SFM35642.1 hypothetical protein SAMN05192571_101106 [Pleomorphomonas diazotrophica]
MPKRRPVAANLDLFKDYQPAPVVERYVEGSVRAYDLAGRLSKAVAKTLEESGMGRAEVAKAMADLLQDDMSKNMLDNYASQAKEHVISALRLFALVAVTGDPRALNMLLAPAGMIVVPAKYEPLIEREIAKEELDRLQRKINAADAAWRAGK